MNNNSLYNAVQIIFQLFIMKKFYKLFATMNYNDALKTICVCVNMQLSTAAPRIDGRFHGL